MGYSTLYGKLYPWHCATVPRQRLPACHRPRYAAAPALGVNTRSRRSSIAAVHCRRPCVSRGCGARVEQSVRFRHGVNVAAHVQATPEDCRLLFAKSYWTLVVSDDLNTFHRTPFYLRLILFGVSTLIILLVCPSVLYVYLLTVFCLFLANKRTYIRLLNNCSQMNMRNKKLNISA